MLYCPVRVYRALGRSGEPGQSCLLLALSSYPPMPAGTPPLPSRVFLSLWLTAPGMLWPCFQLEALDTGALQITIVYISSDPFPCKLLEKVSILMAAALTAEFSPLCLQCHAANFTDLLGIPWSRFWLWCWRSTFLPYLRCQVGLLDEMYTSIFW